MKASAAIFFSSIIVFLLLCFYLSNQFSDFFDRPIFRWKKKYKPKPLDSCFESFMGLLKGHNMSEKYIFIEPSPPVPVEKVSAACRHHLIPKPAPPSLSMETIKCYSHRFVTNETRGQVRERLLIVKKLFDDNKIPLIIDGGSLIGSTRYHSMVPYDDDFDFRVPRSEITKIRKVLADLCKKDARFRCTLSLSKMDHYQVHVGSRKRNAFAIISFMDFFFYSIQGDKIRVTDIPHGFAKSVIFPTIKRPLEGLLFDCPRDAEAYRRLYYSSYKPNECHAYDHNHHERKGCRKIPCSDLNSFLPFMVASKSLKGRIELVVERSHVRSIFFQRK